MGRPAREPKEADETPTSLVLSRTRRTTPNAVMTNSKSAVAREPSEMRIDAQWSPSTVTYRTSAEPAKQVAIVRGKRITRANAAPGTNNPASNRMTFATSKEGGTGNYVPSCK